MNITSDKTYSLQATTMRVLSIGPRTCEEIALTLGTSERSARHILQALCDEGRVRLAGRKRTTRHRKHAYLFAAVAA